MNTKPHDNVGEQEALRKEQVYIREMLGMKINMADPSAGLATAAQEDYISSCDELDDDNENSKLKVPGKTISTISSDGGYSSSSDEEKGLAQINESPSVIVDLSEALSCPRDLILPSSTLQDLPTDIKTILDGMYQGLPNDYAVPIDKKPNWFDTEKYKLGQEFAQRYYFGLNYAEMLSLLILFAFPDGLKPLIFTGNSGTPFTAFRRYLSTALRVKSWFEHDIWDEESLGYKNLKTVRAMHLNVSKRLNSTPLSEIESKLTLSGSQNDTALWCPLKEDIREDFMSCCPFQPQRPMDVYTDPSIDKVFVNQLEMSITQFGFVGLMITYPEKFGAGDATEEQLDGFVHLWKCLGYLLGIEDKYNFCNGTLNDVRQRCHFLIDNWAKPSLQHINEDWEHMSRCLVEGISYYVPGLSFEVSLLYLCWILDISMPRLHASLTWWQYCMFNLMKFTLFVTLKIPGMIPLHSWLIRRSLERASTFSPDQLKRLEARTYDYEKKGSFNTRL